MNETTLAERLHRATRAMTADPTAQRKTDIDPALVATSLRKVDLATLPHGYCIARGAGAGPVDSGPAR